MAESIKNQVDALTGFASTEDLALQDWCDAGAKEIINILPPRLLLKCITTATLSNSPTTLTNFDTRGRVFAVTRSDGTRQIPCREISSLYRGMVDDSSDIIHFATTSDPVFLKYNNALYVYPVPTSDQNAYIEHTSYPTVNMASSTIGNFPDEAEYLVVLYAAQKALLRRIGDLTIPPNVGGAAESLTASMSAIDGGQIGTDAEFLNFRYWFTTLSEMIEYDEYIELASAQIEKINAYVNTWNIQLQGNLAEMQQYMALFQTLKADYVAGIQMLVSGGMPQAQQKARR